MRYWKFSISYDYFCRTVSYAIPPQNQLVMRKTLKYFMAFDIAPRGHVFRVAVGSQIAVPLTILPSQWYSRDSNPWPWLWYHLSDRELCHSISKPIGDEEDTLKFFMAFDITPRGLVFRVVVVSQIVVSQQFPITFLDFLSQSYHQYSFLNKAFLPAFLSYGLTQSSLVRKRLFYCSLWSQKRWC